MMNTVMTPEQVDAYCVFLAEEERAVNTISKYRRDLTRLCAWMDGKPVTKLLMNAWKQSLLEHYTPASINSMLAAANGFFHHMGWDGCRTKFLKIQRRAFCDKNRELSREEYEKLVNTASKMGKMRLSLTLETLCGLGLRVSELKFITVEAVRRGRVEIRMKGKVRTVLISGKLSRKLVKYAGKKKIASGEIFVTKSGRGLSRGQIWQEMKRLCRIAGVETGKVFPHNLRHLFARAYYRVYKDIVKLADMLGHTSVETTRIYLISTGEEHARQLEKLGLVS